MINKKNIKTKIFQNTSARKDSWISLSSNYLDIYQRLYNSKYTLTRLKIICILELYLYNFSLNEKNIYISIYKLNQEKLINRFLRTSADKFIIFLNIIRSFFLLFLSIINFFVIKHFQIYDIILNSIKERSPTFENWLAENREKDKKYVKKINLFSKILFGPYNFLNEYNIDIDDLYLILSKKDGSDISENIIFEIESLTHFNSILITLKIFSENFKNIKLNSVNKSFINKKDSSNIKKEEEDFPFSSFFKKNYYDFVDVPIDSNLSKEDQELAKLLKEKFSMKVLKNQFYFVNFEKETEIHLLSKPDLVNKYKQRGHIVMLDRYPLDPFISSTEIKKLDSSENLTFFEKISKFYIDFKKAKTYFNQVICENYINTSEFHKKLIFFFKYIIPLYYFVYFFFIGPILDNFPKDFNPFLFKVFNTGQFLGYYYFVIQMFLNVLHSFRMLFVFFYAPNSPFYFKVLWGKKSIPFYRKVYYFQILVLCFKLILSLIGLLIAYLLMLSLMEEGAYVFIDRREVLHEGSKRNAIIDFFKRKISFKRLIKEFKNPKITGYRRRIKADLYYRLHKIKKIYMTETMKKKRYIFLRRIARAQELERKKSYEAFLRQTGQKRP